MNTPTPWHIEENDGYYYVLSEGKHIGDYDTVMHDETYYNHAPSREDAELIVRAVNAHEALLTAAKMADCGRTGCESEKCAFARAAIALAEKGTSD